jgi:hypothetical protein
MSLSFRRCCMTFLLFVAHHVHGQSTSTVIRGNLKENGKPISEATVFLQSLDDEKCAKLFSSGKADNRTVRKFGLCVHDLSEASPDASGNYHFNVPKAGWYAIHFLWNVGEKPRAPQTAFKRGTWSLIYAGYKDTSGRYDAMAQETAFYFGASEDAVHDCDVRWNEVERPGH